MGWQDQIGQIPNGDEFFYAVGQGALAVEIRSGLVSVINDRETELCCLAERALMLHVQGGCSIPTGVKGSTIKKDSQERQSAVLEIAYFSVEDNQRVTYMATFAMHTREDAEKLGQYIAQKMLEAGADSLLQAARICNKENTENLKASARQVGLNGNPSQFYTS
ncbi:porphobilinogen deaminase-like [Zophobas morio]|uniref:porphobilinogen deaminase-like n=1 Tax=Zophobas morio TaxID=2755281 RepID=UPI003083BB5C